MVLRLSCDYLRTVFLVILVFYYLELSYNYLMTILNRFFLYFWFFIILAGFLLFCDYLVTILAGFFRFKIY